MEVCGAVHGWADKACCMRPKGHGGEHINSYGVRWPYTSVEILRKKND